LEKTQTMNKYTLIATFCLLFLFNDSQAQFRAKAGITYADVNYQSVINANLYDPAVGLNLGVSWTNSLSRKVATEIGLSYFKIGASSAIPGNFDVKHNYIGLPLIFQLDPNSLFSVGAGLMASMKIGSTAPEVFYEENFDASALLRLNVNVFQNLRFEIGYNHGFVAFSRISETGINGELLNEAKLRNRHISLMAAFRL
jgi:hypothetical protein